VKATQNIYTSKVIMMTPKCKLVLNLWPSLTLCWHISTRA